MTEEQVKNTDSKENESTELKEELTDEETSSLSVSGAPSRDLTSGLANPIIGEAPAPNYSLTKEELKSVSGGVSLTESIFDQGSITNAGAECQIE